MEDVKKVILFDTDIGDDCDDVMALDVLIAAHKAGECELAAVTYSERCPVAPGCARAILRYYGLEIPVGSRPTEPGRGTTYAKAVFDAFPSLAAGETLPAVRVMRKVLAEHDKATFVVTGSLYNVAKLIESEPDDLSPLNGIDLMKEKLEEIALMGGNFSHQSGYRPPEHTILPDGTLARTTEWNITLSLPESRLFFEKCPCPITASPFELGFRMLTGGPMVEAGQGKTPDSLSYIVHGSSKGRDSWDPTTAYYGLYGAAPLFYKTAPGTITVDEKGVTYFTPGEGSHALLYPARPDEEIAAAIDAKALRLYKSFF